MKQRIVLASSNEGKLRELRALLDGLDFTVVGQAELGIEAAEEPHATFLENALAKARHAAGRSGLPALADDSGLCVAALRGAPGVRSARFAGEGAGDAANNAELLRQLAQHTDRRGHYICVLVAVRAADDPEPLVAEARWHGEVLSAPQGAGGFGYDPLFFVPELGCTAAELPAAEKNRISHRGQALQALRQRLADWR
ncbi:MAG: RdgB/HAM1 family non-canonical purine NTP pyrophosphatase [Burkholderiaceae bacterium]|jgi:XTP/dITP diphosphohydrolase|nr:RdgB/HAM1 family non-canonical purine NTP pyrophosphatase [Burkholderiaceae bacterium]